MKPIKILHTADWHIGEFTGPVIDGQNAREIDTLKCIDFLVDQAKLEDVDAILISGDLFDKSKLWGDTMLRLIGVAAERLRKLAAIAPTVLLFGTANHDSMKAFQNLDEMAIPNLSIITVPRKITIHVKVDEYKADGYNDGYLPVQIVGVPGYDKGYFRAQNPGMSAEEENKMCSEMLGNIVLGLNNECDSRYPSVLMSHYTVVGCQLDNGEHIFQQSDVVLPKEALQSSSFDLICLGHIHRAQQLTDCGKTTYYSGPPNALTFNEEGQDKGFWMHNCNFLEPIRFEASIHSRFIKTPSRRFYTQEWDEQDVEMFVQGYPVSNFAFKDAIVRLHYTCSDELNKQLNRKTLEKALYDAGAFDVVVRPVKLIEELKKESLTETLGPLENLTEWLQKEGYQGLELDFLIELARPMIATVSAKMPTGKFSGIFVPKSLRVKNYRSYKEEFFDFSPLHFAIVSGSNGVGKSAFFGDAISDCLYEEIREGRKGDLTGWINNDTAAKSGMLDFIFGMGETDWRVVRTRAKSGKVTLSLSELINDEWADRSCTKKDDTQAKIISLMGMDAMTFRSCALIMQDAYGLFLEADREERMLVLGNLLGLSVYEQLAELAKAKVTEVNRSIEKSKMQIMALDEKLKDKAELESNLQAVNIEIEDMKSILQEKEKSLSEIEKTINTLFIRAEKGKELNRQAVELTNQKLSKENTLKEHDVKRLQAINDLSQKSLVLETVAEYEQVKDQIAALDAKLPRLNELKSQSAELVRQNISQQISIIAHKEKITHAETILSKETTILESVSEYERIKQQITVLETKQPRLDEIAKENNQYVFDLTSIYDELATIDEQIKEIESALADKPELEKAVITYRENVVKLSGQDDLEQKNAALSFKLREAQQILFKAQTAYNASKTSFETQIKTLSGKVEMLANSNCIDPENAKCNFLADAQAAKAKLIQVRADYDVLTTDDVNNASTKCEEISKQIADLNYDPVAHRRLKDLIAELLPKTERAAALSGKEEVLANLQEQRKNQISKRDDLSIKRDNSLNEYRALENELEPLNGLKDHLPTLEKALKDKDDLPVARETLKTSNDAVALLETESADKAAQVKLLDLEANTIINELVNLPELKRKLPSLEWAVKAKEQLPVAREILKTTTDAMAMLDTEIDAIKEQIRTIGYEIDAIDNEQPKLHQLQLSAKIIAGDIKELQVKQNDAHGRVGALKSQVDALCKDEAERDSIAKEIEPTAKELVRYSVLSVAFGLDGIPFAIVRSVVPELSVMANDILGQMTGGQMTLEMRTERIQKSSKKEINALEIWITDYQRGSLPYKSRSGGQKVKSALSVAFALADLKARRAGIQLGMMFVDEPPFLDAAGTEAYCDALELLEKRHQNMMVIAISHDPAMKARFPQEIVVEDTGEGGSKVRLIS